MLSCSLCKEQRSSNPSEEPELSYFYCKACFFVLCPKCLCIHLPQSPNHLINIFFLCDDCENAPAPLFCRSCGQNLCSDCDIRIHNKGKRAQHVRETRETPISSLLQRKKALLFCSQNFLKDFENNLRAIIQAQGYKELILLMLQVMKEEKVPGFEKGYEPVFKGLEGVLGIKLEVLVYSFEKHAKNKLKTFIRTNPLILESKEIIESAVFITTGIKYLDLQILEEIFTEKEALFSPNARLFFLETLDLKALIFQELRSPEQMKVLETRTFEEISRKTGPYLQKEESSFKNPNSSFQFQMNTSSSSFESSTLFMPNASLLNHSFGGGTTSLSQNELIHNNSFDHNRPEQTKTSIYLPYFQRLRELEIKGLVKLGMDLQRELHRLANEGELLLSKGRFLELAGKLIKGTLNDAENLLKEAEQASILHITIRKFEGYPERQDFVSLNLEYLSLESLVWVLKSIRKDAMTPTEKIILSRIKECFRLKITPKQWERVLQSIKLSKFSQENDPYSTLNKPPLPFIVLSKIKDPLIGNETNVLKFRNGDWAVEDQGKVEEEKDILWKVFIGFLNSYFKAQNQRSQLAEIPEKAEKTSESEINLNENSELDNKLRETSLSEMKLSDEGKSIPGGRYGCAQFIKTCAPEELRKCSLGRLNLYVQEAINKGFIKYHRTLLVKDYSREEDNSYLDNGNNVPNETGVSSVQRDAKIKALQKTILEILRENPNGVSLAQIPQFLKMKALFPFNLQELGFPKLKNFLATIPEKIKIEMAGTNNSYAYLVEPVEEIPIKQGNILISTPVLDRKALKKKFNTLKFPITETIQPSKAQNRKKVSSVEEYLNKVINLIYSILIEHNYGLRSDKLYSELNKKLTVEFNFHIFNCPDFYTFLAKYLENMIDIECKNFSFYIYPKDFRFGPLLPRKTEFKEFKDLPIDNNNNREKERFWNKPRNNLNLNSTPFNYNEKLNQKNGLFSNNQAFPASCSSFNKFNTINNMMGLTSGLPEEDIYSLHKKSLSIANYGPSLYKGPGLFFNLPSNNQENSHVRSPSHNRNISFWNINGPAFDPACLLNNGSISIHSRNDSKNTVNRKNNEESNIELNENLKFIEELLQEKDDQEVLNNYEKGNETNSMFKSGSFSMNTMPNNNYFNMISAIKPSPYDFSHNMNEKMHSKALSDDFNDFHKKKLEEKANNIKQHGRVQSNLENNKINSEDSEKND